MNTTRLTLSLTLSLALLLAGCGSDLTQATSSRPAGLESAASTALVVYGDSLDSGWSDWSWSQASINLASTLFFSGSRGVLAKLNAWGAFSPRASNALTAAEYTGLSFQAYHVSGGKRLRVSAYTSDGTISGSATVDLTTNAWKPFTLSWAQLGNPAQIKRLAFQDDTGSGSEFALDDLKLTPASTPTPTGCSSLASLDESAVYTLTAKHSGKALDVEGVSLSDGARIQQWAYGGGDNQKWTLSSVGEGFYKITSLKSGKAIDVEGGTTATQDGAAIHQWGYGGWDNQKWCLSDVGGGFVKIIAKHSGKALAINANLTSDGAKAIQWPYLAANDNFKFKLEKVSTTTPPPTPSTWKLSPGINLGSALEAPAEGDWNYTIAQDHLRLIKEAGFKSVRIPIRWSSHAPKTAPYTIDPAFFTRVDNVVKWANDQGLLAVIDMHHWGYNDEDYGSLFVNPDSQRQRFMKLWEQVANHYRGYGNDRVYFELLNEPHDGDQKGGYPNGTWTTCTSTLPADKCFKEDNVYWAGFLQEGLQVIRNSGGNNATRQVIIGNAQWNNPLYSLNATFANALPASDRNIIVTMHMYEAQCFSHYAWEPQHTCQTWNGTAAEKAKITDAMNAIVDFKNTYNRPIYIGEWGPTVGKDGRLTEYASRVRYSRYVASELVRLNLDYAFFDFASKTWGIFDAGTGTWQAEMRDAALNR